MNVNMKYLDIHHGLNNIMKKLIHVNILRVKQLDFL